MAEVDALFSAVRSFLCSALGSVPLPPAIEEHRRNLLERMDALLLGRTPSGPETKTLPTPVARRRPLNTVARLFSLSRKRYSMPASIGCTTPSVLESCAPPLPPKNNSFIRGQSLEPDQDYEVPKTVIASKFDGVPLGTLSNPSQIRRHPLNRLSLSPQLEILQTNWSQTQLAPPVPSIHSLPVPPDNRDDLALTLPKKCTAAQTRRFSAFMDSAWTLAGLLHHRYKPNKWTRLNLCLLSSGSRLIAYKSTHAMSPSLVLFLCGTTGIYAGRDSGMEYVIKIAHPTHGTTVLAAETEQQALVWIKQINQYSQGITPSETHSFLEHPILPTNNNMALSSASSCSVPSTPVRPALSFMDPAESPTHRDRVDAQEDSGFSAPVSSGSEGNSGDGVINGQLHRPSAEVLTSHCLSSSTLLLSSSCSHPPALATVDAVHEAQSQTENGPVFDSGYSLNSSARSTISSASKLLRREGFLSSMRRKVESFSSKRRARKSLPPASSFEQPFSLLKSSSSADVQIHKRTSPLWSSGASNPSATQTYSLDASSAYIDNRNSRLFGAAYDWSHLEFASDLFLHPEHAGVLPGSRSHSSTSTCGHSNALRPPSAEPLNHKQLMDLCSASITLRRVPSIATTCDNRVIVSGEACISIPGRLPWTNRWCCLHPRCLEIYAFVRQTSYVGSDINRRQCAASTACPLFSLSLEPGQVELGLAGDKHRKAALRLAVPKQSKIPLLFDSPDKIQMGAWIRGFIEALGIITPDPAQQSSNEIFTSPVGVPCSRDAPNSETAEYAVPERVAPNVLGGGPSASLDSETDIVVLDNLNDLSADLDSIQLYDEVYPMQYGRRSTKNLNASPHKRRWSSPFVHSAPISRSNDCLEQNTGFIVGNHSNRWCVPPPSRRLLAQPLPPLPSVGPSGAESMAGTIASSHTSSNLTADESVLQQEEAASEPEISIPTWSSTRAKCHVPLRKRRTSCCSRSPRLSPDTNHQVLPNLPRRHSSLISLYYQLPYNEPMVDVASGIPDPIGPLPALRDDLDEVDTVNMSTTTHNHHALGLDFASSSRSYDTSTTCAGFPSDLSLPCTEDIYSTDWRLRPLPSWPEDSPCAKPVNVSLAAAAARRSVSCITGTKPRIASLEDPRIISTLPPRHELDSAFSNHLVDPVAHLLPGMVPTHPRINLFHRTAQSSHSSQTTTSSGAVAVACPSSSPISEGTTRPASSTISWPPPAPEEEESEGYHVDWYLKPHPESNEATSPPDASESLAVARQPSNPISVSGRQCETVTDGVAHSGGDDYSPMNTSLILVATQLEEVQHGAQKLRSRRETLSFRLSNRLTKERSDKSETSPRPVSTEKTVVGNDASRAGICSQRDTAREDDGTEEATASLYARLAAIEMLISQAASMEARLRDEMIRYLPYGSSAPDPAFSTGLQLTDTCALPDTHFDFPPSSQQTHRRRGRCYRNVLSPHLPSSGSSIVTPNTLSSPHSRGRGRGGRPRRRRYGAPPFTNAHHRGQSWSKSDASSTLPVPLSPMV